jgi:outer membrane protein assembly factor BamD
VSIERRVENVDHQAVIEEANAFLLQFPGNQNIDRVMYLLGKTYFELDEYVQSESYFSRIQREFPESDYADDAYFFIGDLYLEQALPAHYDQEMTIRALGQFLRFIELYPNSELISSAEEKVLSCRERLAQKRFLNGKLYAKLGRYEIAAKYFGEVAVNYADTTWGTESLLKMGETLEELGRIDEARNAYQTVLNDGQATAAQRESAMRKLSQLER